MNARFVDDDVDRHADESFSFLREQVVLASKYGSPDVLSAAIHLWAITHTTLLHERCRAIQLMCKHGHGKEAMVAMRAATEYAVKLQFEFDDPIKALRVMAAEPVTDRIRARAHMGTLEPKWEKMLLDDLAQARQLYLAARPDLAGATVDAIDEAMSREQFPNMAFLITKYIGDSREYVVRYMFPAGVEHGSNTGVRHAVQIVANGGVEPKLELSDGLENDHLLRAAGYAIFAAGLLNAKYDLGNDDRCLALRTKQLEFITSRGLEGLAGGGTG